MTLVTHIEGSAVAVYEKPLSGSALAPWSDPENHLDLIRFHSDLDYYRLFMGPTTVTVNFNDVPADNHTISSWPVFNFLGQTIIEDYDLLTHGLGYIPAYYVIWNNTVVTPGTMIQVQDDVDGRRIRRVTPFATTTKIGITSMGISSDPGDLDSLSEDFIVVVFVKPTADEPGVTWHWETLTGDCSMGFGMFKSSEKMLRAGLPGDSPYDIQLTCTLDISNGQTREILGDGVIRDEPNYNGFLSAPTTFDGVIS